MLKFLQNKKSDWQSFLAGNTCIACGLPWQPSFIQRASKTKLGDLTFSQNQDNAKNLLRQIRLCSHCLAALPVQRPLIWREIAELPFPIMTIFAYQEPIKRLLLQLKFYQKAYLADDIAKLIFLLTRKNWREIAENTILCPVPLSAKRLRERGYNQADLIAGKLAGGLAKIDYQPNLLLRIKHTKRQTETKNRDERRINLKNAFCLNQNVLKERGQDFLKDKEIILLDDIVTSGMTLHYAAKPLLEQNCRIKALAIATEKVFC